MGPNAYILCGTPRTGSTLLCAMLTATKAAGDPDSYFMPRFMLDWAARWGLKAADLPGTPRGDHTYLRAAIAAGSAGTGIFGLRLMHENLTDLTAMLCRIFPDAPTERARMEQAFGPLLFVHLTREDKVAQAISLVKAEQTGLWHVAADGSELERLAPPAAPAYDFARLHASAELLRRDDAGWKAWFQRQGIAPLCIRYEDLSADPAAEATRVLSALGHTVPPGILQPAVARLSDALSTDWSARYHRDLAARP